MDLAVDIGNVDRIGIDEQEMSDPGAAERLGSERADAADPEDGDMRPGELCKAVRAEEEFCPRKSVRHENFAASLRASSSHRSFQRLPACPLTQWKRTVWREKTSSSACHKSWFLTGSPVAVRQPFRFQLRSQYFVKAFFIYWLSV